MPQTPRLLAIVRGFRINGRFFDVVRAQRADVIVIGSSAASAGVDDDIARVIARNRGLFGARRSSLGANASHGGRADDWCIRAVSQRA